MNTQQPLSPMREITKQPDVVGESSAVIAIAWPTGRPIRSYTVDELAEGVDLYTRAIKACDARIVQRGDDDAR